MGGGSSFPRGKAVSASSYHLYLMVRLRTCGAAAALHCIYILGVMLKSVSTRMAVALCACREECFEF
jgi:hypothetical protein